MRGIKQTSAFKCDLKRESKGQHRAFLAKAFLEIVRRVANDEPLAENFHDHPLMGNWKDHRNCYLRPDLVLIYKKPDADTLQLIRLGSHSELSL
jgi:mRNA interferase YafQ